MSESFWNIPPVDNVQTPFAILKEQADSLTGSTKHKLFGRVDRRASGGNIDNKLSIRVPALDDYQVDLISYEHGIEMYPGYFNYELGGKSTKVTNESDLRKTLKDTLGSDEVGKVVRSLLAQAEAA